jgi:hypothetical protein
LAWLKLSSTLGHKQFNQLPGHDYEKSVFGPAVSHLHTCHEGD